MKYLLLIISTFWVVNLYAQNNVVEVNANVMYNQEGHTSFDREKYIGVHAGIRENDWTQYGASNPVDVKNDFLNLRDIYLGRNTGTITWNINSVLREDPNRPGFVDLDHLRSEAQKYRNQFSTRPDFVNYLDRNNDFILAAQHHPFYPDGTLTNKGWAFSQKDTQNEPFGTASGEYCAHFIKEFYGNGSEQTPKYFEVINEPIYGLYGCEDCGEKDEDIESIFRYHNAVATEVKKINPSILVGGFTSAFPNFDYENFQRWEKRWDKFMNMCGDNMDFWSVHLYDWPEIRNKRLMRKGSRVEATLDMLEHASMDKFGVVKPILVSEYGSQVHTLIQSTWSEERDWHLLRSYISLAMSFMDRPQHIAKALPFIVLKATWGTQPNGNPYNTRVLRKEGEPENSNGEWIYTELIRFYDFWKGVDGTKVDIISSNLDIQTIASVDGNRLFVILNNLNRNTEVVDLNIKGYEGNTLQKVNIRHLYGNNGLPVFTESSQTSSPSEVTLQSESAMVLEYVFENNITVNESSEETKYYADLFYLPITNGEEIFQFSGVNTSNFGEAVLRIGIGRAHQLSKQPEVKVNGVKITVPDNVRGELQEDRDGFFGVLEVPVPYQLISSNTSVSVTFPDNGGHISSVNMRVSNFSTDLERSPENTPNLNTVSFNNAPSVIQPNQEVVVDIDYNATEQLDIVTIINAPNGAWLANKTTRVNAGNGTVTLSIPPSSNWAVGNNYKLGICIRPKGGGFDSNLDYKSTFYGVTNAVKYSLQNQGSFNYISSANPNKMNVINLINDTELFEVVNNADGSISLKGDNGLYVSSENGQKELTCIRSSIGAWEKFTLVNFGNEIYGLKGNNNMYVRNNMLCTSEEATNWQKFKLTIASSSSRIVKQTDVDLKAQFHIYPNPTKGKIKIAWGEVVNEATLSVYTIHGELIESKTINANTFNLEKLEAGLYLLKFDFNEKTINKKILIQ